MTKVRSQSYYRKRYGKAFLEELDRIIDILFQAAYEQEYTWEELAREAGVSGTTVRNLGERKTRCPHLRTVILIGIAVGYKINLVEKVGKKPKITWSIVDFQGRRKKVA